ncbi:MAG: hypothetical protein MMC33_006494 [Icmadophila ericetorum]|nr:hypothetical protein [Icmadophila ericetorum]
MSQGRRAWIIVGNVLEIIGTLLSATSYGPGQLIAGRVVIGVGNGLITSMCPIYVAEMAVEPKKRGRGVDMLIAMATSGASLAYWTDFGMVFTSGQVVWRFPVAFVIVIALTSIALIAPLPDTPRWYYAKDREAVADSVLQRLTAGSMVENQFDAIKAEIIASIELEQSNSEGLRLKDFFWDTSATQSARRIRTGMILLSLAYLQGIDFLFYYTTTIFQSYIGLAPLTASSLSGALNTVEALFNWTSLPFLERMGRRQWLLIGGSLQTLFLIILTGLVAHAGPKTAAAAAAMLFGFVVAFGPGWGPFAYVYSSEIMPLRYRHIGFSLSISCQWLFAFVTVFAGPIAVENGKSHGWATWIWFVVFNGISVPFVYFCCPETRGRSLEEIDLVFMQGGLGDTDAGQTLARGGVGMESCKGFGEDDSFEGGRVYEKDGLGINSKGTMG